LRSGAQLERYAVEPYVMAGDVYGAPPHEGRGGWTWYTGSAAWMYRLAVEQILVIRRRGDRLLVVPCLPSKWKGYSATLSAGKAVYKLSVEFGEGRERRVEFDGKPWKDDAIPFKDDEKPHTIRVVIPRPSSPQTNAANEPRSHEPQGRFAQARG
jgi:cellobiose phosphorylase